MNTPPPSNLEPLLTDLRTALEDLYGDRLVRLVLYGSQDASPDEGRRIPAREPDSSPFEHGIQNELGPLGTVDGDFRSLASGSSTTTHKCTTARIGRRASSLRRA